MDQLRKPFAIITFFFICLILTLKLFGPVPLVASQNTGAKATSFEIIGIGKATEIPNSAKLTFSVAKTASAVSDAQYQTNTVINTILQNVKAAGITPKDVTTINYSVFPQYNFDANGKQSLSGYSVTQDIEVNINPIDKTSKIIDIASSSGATQIGGISFIFDETTRKNLEEKARNEAILNAKEKAKSLAEIAGIRLGKIINIKETPANPTQPVPFTATSVNSEQSQTFTQLSPGGNTISSTVTLTYETY